MNRNAIEANMAGPRPPTPHELLISAINEESYHDAYLLMQAGADINTPDENGETPLILMLKSRMEYCEYMETYGNYEEMHETIELIDKIIHWMFANAAATDVIDLEERSVLDLIIENDYNEYLFISAIQQKIYLPDDAVDKLIAGKLISEDLTIFISGDMSEALEIRDIAGPVQASYPMPMAAAFGNERLLTLLLEKNITDPLEKCYDYYDTSLYQAMRKHQWGCAEILIQAGHSYIHDPDALITEVLTTGICTNMTVVNYCVSNISDSCDDPSDTGFEGLISMLNNANVDIYQPDALGTTLYEATLDCGLKGPHLYKLLAVLLGEFPELITRAIEDLSEDHKGLQFLYHSDLAEETNYADQLYEFISDHRVSLEFDSTELLEWALDTYAASWLTPEANNLM